MEVFVPVILTSYPPVAGSNSKICPTVVAWPCEIHHVSIWISYKDCWPFQCTGPLYRQVWNKQRLLLHFWSHGSLKDNNDMLHAPSVLRRVFLAQVKKMSSYREIRVSCSLYASYNERNNGLIQRVAVSLGKILNPTCFLIAHHCVNASE